jgi:metal-responsive CopG/Arc/MetJ family transcriptional regulator
MTRESLWIALDEELVRELDALAKAKGITRHEAARIVLRLGVELLQRQQRGGR